MNHLRVRCQRCVSLLLNISMCLFLEQNYSHIISLKPANSGNLTLLPAARTQHRTLHPVVITCWFSVTQIPSPSLRFSCPWAAALRHILPLCWFDDLIEFILWVWAGACIEALLLCGFFPNPVFLLRVSIGRPCCSSALVICVQVCMCVLPVWPH